ncbi:zinc finger protein 595-like [Belonocnema kinseyi]|uniref:zinc finger protein 595-like n=1 Tax=Belonocnema kinseyi TaxID=2817044 RepID=UPI00143DB0F4|nr:zinc finger protein 595-like [Belonocnema kinseyi]
MEIKEEMMDFDRKIDKTLEIKKEIFEDQDTTGQKLNKKHNSELYTVDIKETNNVAVDDKLLNHNRQELKKSKLETGKKYECEKCKLSYILKSSLDRHQKFECLVPPKFVCKFCKKRFTQNSSLNTHIGRAHQKEKKSGLIRKGDKINFAQFLDEDTIVQKGNETNDSKFCTVYIRGDDILEVKPKLETLKEAIQSPDLERKHTCEKCARSYKWKTHLNQHLKYDCDVKPQFECKFCGKKFRRNNMLNIHIARLHQKSNSDKSSAVHKCDKCPRTYTWYNALSRHKRLEHATVKPEFVCDYCGYSTNRKSSLTRHIIKQHIE